MTENYGEDLYQAPADLDDTSYDTTLADDAAGNDLLWETEAVDGQTLDAVTEDTGTDPLLDVPPAPELPDYTDPLEVPQGGDIPVPAEYTDPLEVPQGGDIPVPEDYTETPTPIDPTDGSDPYADAGTEAPVEDPYADAGTTEDPYADAGTTEDPYAEGTVDPNDPNVGLDPTDPNYDHYYAEHGYPYEGPSDVSDVPVEDDNSEAPSDPLPTDIPTDYSDYDADAYVPTEYPYESPYEYPGYDEGYDPYADPAYDPYAEGAPYGGDYDVVYDPCWGDYAYDPYNDIFVEVNVTVEGDVYVEGDQSADVYVVNEGDTYVDNSTTYVDNSTTIEDNSTNIDYTETNVDYTETTVVQEEVVYYEGWDADSAPVYDSYGPMEIAHYTPDWTVADFDGVGDPLADAAYFHEVENPVNAPLATEGAIIEKLTGEPYNEAALVQQAENAGFFDPELGMTNTDVGSLLELHGIETETVYDADVNTLIDALESGDPVMAVVDVNETGIPMRDVVTGEPIEQNPSVMGSVWVTGMDVQPDGSVYVIVNDPSWPEGQTQAIALEDFTNAWYDGGNQAVIAHQPA